LLRYLDKRCKLWMLGSSGNDYLGKGSVWNYVSDPRRKFVFSGKSFDRLFPMACERHRPSSL
jgi:hypothetical protein